MGNGEKFDDRTVVGDRSELEESARQISQALGQRACFVVLSGPDVGSMYPLPSGAVIGRGLEADVRLRDTECSRAHAKIDFVDDAVIIEDLHSTNGTFVNGEQIAKVTLCDGDRVQFGGTTILKFSYQDALEEQFQRRLYESAVMDKLTGAYNKAHFHERLQSEFAYAHRHGSKLALTMLDIDHFKVVNDEMGHRAGDYVLARLGEMVRDNLREEDIFCRYGGEEFALISRGLAGQDAILAADRMRRCIGNAEYLHNNRLISVTVSLGVAWLPTSSIRTAEDLVQMADERLYAAKRSGRNRVEPNLHKS